jgi:hypothetical protein
MIDALQVFVRGFEDVERGEVIISYLTELGFRVKLAADGGSDSLGGLIETDVVYQDELQETDPGIILGELRERTDFNGLWLQTREFHLSDQSEYGRGDVEEDDETHDDEWIIEHADKLKAELLDLAEAGNPRPEPGTTLGRALELFTSSFGA